MRDARHKASEKLHRVGLSARKIFAGEFHHRVASTARPESAANAYAGAVVAAYGGRAHDWPMRDDRAAWSNASRVVDAGCASGSVSLRDLNGEKPQN